MASREGLDSLAEHGGQWERWTVDEVFDGLVRLLMCQAAEGASSAVIPRLPSLLDGGPEQVGGSLTDTAMTYELAPTVETWTDEVAAVVELASLDAFLRGRTSLGGLPGPRPVREGDVFWVFVPATAGAEAADTADALEAYRAAGAVALDLTAAARQVAKTLHRRAESAAAPEPGP